MSNREEYIGVRVSASNEGQSGGQSFSFSNTKNKINNTAGAGVGGKHSSSKKKGKTSKIFSQKLIDGIEKAQIKTPQSQAARTRKGVAVNK